jgi:AraC family transcriptional regulator of adaptative response / DNA-3-methyladenine glycosylase II
MELTPDVCFRALSTRDTRFDGLFFVGVTSTRIYCRPVCTARTPRAEHCRFYTSAAAAEQAGFRPCLKCRPELAPGHAPVDAAGHVARAAAARIEAGALNDDGSLDELAREFGLSARQLRRVIRRELGVTPIALAQTRRLLLAKQLLTETRLPMTEVAFASGFASVRRFNGLFQSHYRLNPGRFRRSLEAAPAGAPLRLKLGYRPPLAWSELLRFLAARSLGGIERVDGGAYLRTVALGPSRGWLRVTPARGANVLIIELSADLVPALAPLLARLRRLFDLNARPDLIAAHLGADPRIGESVRQFPGLRVPGAFEGFDVAWRAVVGQRISVRAATTVAGRLAAALGEPIATPDPNLDRLAPLPERVAEATVGQIAGFGLARERALAIQALARAVADGRLRLEPGAEPESVIDQLKCLPGVGEWTAQYIALRALGWPDAFPHGDLGLLRGLNETSPARLCKLAEAWRPWRAYAVMHVWNQPVDSLSTRSRPCPTIESPTPRSPALSASSCLPATERH